MCEGSGIVEARAVAAKFTGFNAEVVRRWAECVFRDFLFMAANIDDEVLEAELESDREVDFINPR